MEIRSSSFDKGGDIPKEYTCEGENISPPFTISGVPEGTRSLALVVYDPDVPKKLQEEKGAPAEWTHWVLFNIGPENREIEEGVVPEGAIQGKNGSGKNSYQGPCPPKEFEPTKHRYFFVLYALDTMMELQEGVSREKFEKAIKNNIVGKCEMIGFYEKE